MTSGGAHPETRRMMERAIRRLNALEYVILGVAMVLALLAGALAAWMVANLTGAPFRISWTVSSLLFFVVPGLVVFRRERLAERGRKGAVGTADSAGATGTEDVTGTADVAGTEDVTEMRDHGRR